MINDYENDLQTFREIARRNLLKYYPDILEINSDISFVIKIMINYGEANPANKIENGKYIFPLIVSFVRTHYICFELIASSELIEAATLIRKQLELLSRLYEISDRTIEELRKKTPQVGVLASQVKQLYGEYSKIAHSSEIQPLELLGVHKAETLQLYKVYPEYSENTIIAYSHFLQVFLNIYFGLRIFLKRTTQNLILVKSKQCFPEF